MHTEFLIMSILMAIFPTFMIATYPKYMRIRGWEKHMNIAVYSKVIKRIGYISSAAMATVFLIALAFSIHEYYHTVGAYHRGDYKQATGDITRYTTYGDEETAVVDFRVREVDFSYSYPRQDDRLSSDDDAWRDLQLEYGQTVCVRYIEHPRYGRRILSIAEASSYEAKKRLSANAESLFFGMVNIISRVVRREPL